jgi:hypothetical protein
MKCEHWMVAALVFGLACGDDDAGGVDGGPDAGADATSPVDTGTRPDAPGTDAPTSDAFTEDAFMPDDAFTPDALVADAGSDAAMSDDAGTDSGPMPGCVDFTASAAGVAAVSGTTTGMGDDFLSDTCDGSGPDVAILFTAPEAGSYAFAANTDFDSVLALHDPDCDALVERACTDDTGDDLDATISTYLDAGAQVIVVLDGLDVDEEGAFSLDITRLADTCPDALLGSGIGTALARDELTAAAGDHRSSSCGYGGGGYDLTYSWSAPADGSYTFALENTPLDLILTLLDGDCRSPELACNDDSVGASESEVTVTLSAGQNVTIVVDGFSVDELGLFDVSIRRPD